MALLLIGIGAVTIVFSGLLVLGLCRVAAASDAAVEQYADAVPTLTIVTPREYERPARR